MDRLDFAIKATVLESEDKARELSEKTGMPYQKLINKASFSHDSEFYLRECISLMIASGNWAIHDEIARIRNSYHKPAIDADPMEILLSISAELGDVCKIVPEALTDGRISLREKKDIFKEIADVKKQIENLEMSLSEH